MTREQAVERLKALGATFAASGDVGALAREMRQRAARLGRRRTRRHHSFESQCGPKRRYPTEAAARVAIRRAPAGPNPDVEPYVCTYCGGWHNGKPYRRGAL